MKISPVQASERCSIRLLGEGGCLPRGCVCPGSVCPGGICPGGCLCAGDVRMPGGGLSAWGMSARGGGGLPRAGAYLGEVSAQRYLPGKGGGVCLGRGVSA